MTHYNHLPKEDPTEQGPRQTQGLVKAALERAVDTGNESFDTIADRWQKEHGAIMLPAYGDIEKRRKFADDGRRETLIGWRDEGVKAALVYLQDLFPEGRFELISDEGSSAVVFGDEHFAYKVLRTPDGYSYVEGEVAAMQRLHDLGLAPRPVAMIDAIPEQQGEFARNELHTDKFADTQIPRIHGHGALPVIVMERVKSPVRLSDAPAGGLKELPNAIKEMMKNDIALWDCEPCYDKATGRIMILDCGGVADISNESNEEKARHMRHTLNSIYTYELRQPNPFHLGKDTVGAWMNLIQMHVVKNTGSN